MADIAVLIKTLDREEALLNCLRSVRERLDEQELSHRIYVADDGPVSPAKREAYGRLRDRGHLVLEFDERVGASRARNELVDRLEDEAFVLRMDDDYELAGETDVAAMRSILERVSSLGAVADLERQVGDGKGLFSGQISDAQGFFERRGDVLVRRLLPPEAFDVDRAGPHRYARCDFTRNFLLIRRELLEEVRWDDRLTFAGEHADFLLQVRASRWEAAFTPDSVHLHRDDLGGAGSGRTPWSARPGERRERRVFREKWGVERTTARRTCRATLRAALVRGKSLGKRALGALRG